MSEKAIVLSSGGLDSTTAIGEAINNYGKENVSTVSFFYGQKHNKELKCADKIAEYYDVKHYVLDIQSLLQYSNCSLLKNSTEDIPHKSYADQIEENGEGKVSTYVPFRNGLMLSSAAALAQSIYPEDDVKIYIGAHADDAAGEAYADCSLYFILAMNQAISIGTYSKVSVYAPFVELNKSQVVKRGLELNVPYELTTSCYEGGEKACGECGTCFDRIEAFRLNGVEDPIEYK